MHALKRSASQAQLPTNTHHNHKRPMHTFPSRRAAQGTILDDAPDGHSLLTRWVTLFSDTFRALWERSAEFASRVVPQDPDTEADLNTSFEHPAPPEPLPHSTLPPRPPIPKFADRPPYSGTPQASSSRVTLSSLSASIMPPGENSRQLSASIDILAGDASAIPRQRYGGQTHIHMAQHKRKIEEHNARELERLRNRRSSISNDLDMEVALKNAKKEFALREGAQLAKQWEDEKAAGSYHSDLDSFTGFQTYKKMILERSVGKSGIRSTPSLPDLGRSLPGSSKVGSQALPRPSSFNLERTLQIAHQSLNEPRPPSPLTFDKLRLAELRKDREIEKRIRAATRLPIKLPPRVSREVKELRLQRGVIARVAREQVADTDLLRLDPEGTLHWLNDEIINFYGALILERSEKHTSNKNLVNGKRHKDKVEYLNIHYFSTFFWPKIEKSYKETRLNKWTKKFDIFQKDVILVPVNHDNIHWTLAAINLQKKRIESYDSMGMYRDNVYKKLRYYLQEEHMDKKKKPFDFTGWIDYYDENTPQQENGYDCGVFTCQFMESLSRGVHEFAFDQKDMPYIRDRMTWEIGNARLWEDLDG